MAEQDFTTIATGDASLLRQVESIVVESHRRLYRSQGRAWSRPIAYRWIRYEHPMPVQRLAEAVEKLEKLGAEFDPEAVEKAWKEAPKAGFPS
jgi:hypothetical protein